MFGVVFQNDVLFADTIYENIDFGRGCPKRRSRKRPGAPRPGSLSPSCPRGCSTGSPARAPTSAAGNASGLLVARALAGSPKILILDDSSSALDYRTDAPCARPCAGSTKASPPLSSPSG